MSEKDTNKRIGFADIIDLRKLERENRHFLWLGYLVAVAVHVLVGAWLEYKLPFVKEQQAESDWPTSIPVEIIVLPPSVRNPYDDWKRETPFRKQQRVITSMRFPQKIFETRVPEPFKGYSDQPIFKKEDHSNIVFFMPIPESLFKRFDPPKFTIPLVYEDLTVEREPRQRFSLRDELLSVDIFDSLKIYKGFVVEDLNNKRNLKGFLYVPKYIREMQLNPFTCYDLMGVVDSLAMAVDLYTDLKIKVDEPVSLAHPSLRNSPLVYLTTVTRKVFRLHRNKARNFGEYLRNGGFAIIDNGRPWGDFLPSEASLLNLLVDALSKNFRFEVLPADHPIYHCFFDIGYPPPEGLENTKPPTKSKRVGPDIVAATEDWGNLLHIPAIVSMQKKMHAAGHTVWGVWVGDRLVAVYLDKGYGHTWLKGAVRYKHSETPFGGLNAGIDNNISAQVQLGINLFVYALRRRDGKATQYTEWNVSRRKR